MRTIQQIIQKAGGIRRGFYLKIENEPYMSLVIETVDEPGPTGLPTLSIAHYGEQNGDAMRDPEMCFEIVAAEDGTFSLDPFYWRNDYVAIEQWSRNLLQGRYVQLSELHKQHQAFADTWDKNLHHQGFADAFNDRHILG